MNISEDFSQREFITGLQHLKPGKFLSPVSICPELIIHAGAALTPSYVTSFFLLVPTQNSQDLEKIASSRNPKAKKAHGGPKDLSTDISSVCPLQDSREAYLCPRRANY